MRWPKPLTPGAKVALLSPSGAQSQDALEGAVESVRALGLVPEVYESCHARHGYLAGPDALRAADMNRAFADPSIAGVLSICGGYGAHRLMGMIDFESIALHPKPFYGYSDITALHLALNQICGLISWHTPMPGTEWYKGLDAYTEKALRYALFGEGEIPLENPCNKPLSSLSPGYAEGQLVGGNLSLITGTLGTPYAIDTRGRILFIEDVHEEPYAVDRMLNQLRGAGKLRDCAGIILGQFTDCLPEEEKSSLSLEEVFAELLPIGEMPILMGLECGHSMPSLCLPLGARVALDAESGTLAMREDWI